MISNTQKFLKREKVLLEAIAKRRQLPLHYNSLMLILNYMLEFSGPKVHYETNDLDSEKIMQVFVKLTKKLLRKYPPEEKLTKIYIASFFASLDSSLVSTEVTPIDFADRLFSLYDDGPLIIE